MFLTVIIPTYRNTKEEIERCLRSIYQSDWRDFEVLLADDGNTAEYAVYLDTLPAQFPGLRVLHLPHGGVSAARNAAVSEARGEYILFVDADDLVTKQFWEDAKEIASRGIEADIVYGMVANNTSRIFLEECGKQISLWELNEEEKRELYAHFFALQRKQFCTGKGYISRGPVARLVCRNFAKRCFFYTTLAIGEDMIWNMDLLRMNPYVFVANHIWYRILENQESATRRYREDRIETLRNVLIELRAHNIDSSWNDYRQMLFAILRDIGTRYYLSPHNPLPWFQKVREFNRVVRSEPFCDAYKLNVKIVGWKDHLKIILCKMGLLLYAYKLKMLISSQK